MWTRHRSIHRDIAAASGVVSPFLGVQSSYSTTNFRAISAMRASQRKKQIFLNACVCRKQSSSQGRMCEVVPPASRRSYFTFLIRTFGAQRKSCSARQVGRASNE